MKFALLFVYPPVLFQSTAFQSLRSPLVRSSRRKSSDVRRLSLGGTSGLPIDDIVPDILRALEETSALVLQAPPGAGKVNLEQHAS